MSDDDDGSTVIIFKIRTNDNNAYGLLFHFVYIHLCILFCSFSGWKNNGVDEWDWDSIEDCDGTKMLTVNLGINGWDDIAM